MLIVSKTSTINAMDLRKEVGALLDKADYLKESFVIERAGKPKAVLIPYTEFEEFQRVRQEAEKRYFQSVESMRESFSNLSEAEIDAIIQAAKNSVRKP